MKKLRYKAYTEDDSLHILCCGSTSAGPQFHAPLGDSILGFLAPDRKNLEELFSGLLAYYRQEAAGPEQLRETFFSRLCPQDNPYLACYLWSAIEMLREPGLPDWVLDAFGSAFPWEPTGSSLRRYPDSLVKRRYIQSLPALLAVQQETIRRELELLWKKQSDLSALAPEQRLFLLTRSGDPAFRSLKKQISFRCVLEATESYDSLQPEALRDALLAKPPRIIQMYEFDTPEALQNFELVQMTLEHCNVKQCANCGRWFIPKGRSDSIYCDRIAPGEGKPCSEIGATRRREETVRQAPAHLAYIAAVKRMSKRRGKSLSDGDYKAWSSLAAQKRDACLNGSLSLETYNAWLDQTSRQNRKSGDTE